jgi:hypothetical protein
LGNKVVANRLDEAMREQMVSAESEYTAGILLSGEWAPEVPGAAEPSNGK